MFNIEIPFYLKQVVMNPVREEWKVLTRPCWVGFIETDRITIGQDITHSWYGWVTKNASIIFDAGRKNTAQEIIDTLINLRSL
jgi:hypothetical protein